MIGLDILASSYADTETWDIAFKTQMQTVAWSVWTRLDESVGTNANDQTVNNRDGTYGNGPTLGQPGIVVGDPSKSVFMDGVNDIISWSNASWQNTTVWTEVIVFKKSAPPATVGHLVSKHSAGIPGDRSRYLKIETDGTVGAVVTDTAAAFFTAQSTTNVCDDEPHIIIATCDGNTVSIYVDGVLENTATRGGSPLNQSGEPLVLCRQSTGGLFVSATIKDYAFKNGTVLSLEQIEDLATAFFAGVPPPVPPPSAFVASYAHSSWLQFPEPANTDVVVVTALRGTNSVAITGGGTWVEITARNQNNRINRIFIGYNFAGTGTISVTQFAFATAHVFRMSGPVLTRPEYEFTAWATGGVSMNTPSIVPNVGDAVVTHVGGPGGVDATNLLSSTGNTFANYQEAGTSSNLTVAASCIATSSVATYANFDISDGVTSQAITLKITPT